MTKFGKKLERNECQMVELSSDRLKNIIDRIKAIVDLEDQEIQNYTLLALIEELEELQLSEKE
jgi:hypothetical protein